ncbi:MAG: ATP-dependent DNA helicase [Alphaproteobacteria bacterium]|nr:ATP-dependent DNA helicase [Alphaproteobacteria bacterium]
MALERSIVLPRAPALVASPARAVWLEPDGVVETLAPTEAAVRARARAPLAVHGPATLRRLDAQARSFRSYDLLELFAFARPAQFCLPTPNGLADAAGLPRPTSLERAAETLFGAARMLLAELARLEDPDGAAADLALDAAEAGWLWGPFVLAALGVAERRSAGGAGFAVWERLPPWIESAPEPPPSDRAITPAEARRRLTEMLGPDAEDRPGQTDYASAATGAFQPRERAGAPHMVVAEAGTGVGKTLGYLAPASLWAEANEAPVWISTYTRNLQHQIDGELDRLIPDPDVKRRRVVVRKGRENYLCLLNLEEAMRGARLVPNETVALVLAARWAEVTRDGDMTGGDFPSWLPDLEGAGRIRGLADRRGECLYSACPHYQRCFIERGIRRARRADLVIANHALVMVQAALGGLDDSWLPTRYVFDEGHHLFDAADSAFAADLSGLETAELRLWLLGAEGSRARGLKRRAEDLAPDGGEAAEALAEAGRTASVLPAEGWLGRLATGAPHGAAERFLALVRQQVLARTPGRGSGAYGLECECRPPVEGLIEAARTLGQALEELRRPLAVLRRALLVRLADEADDLDSRTRIRIEALARVLHRRAETQLVAWSAMLKALDAEAPEAFVDWFELERVQGRERDVGMRRRWVDPMAPFATEVVEPAHGLLVTSATLRDGTREPEEAWQVAEIRTGACHLAIPAIRAVAPSPFDYPAQTRALIVTDVRKQVPDLVAAACRSLFLAAGGGALGLFTAVQRLRAVHERLAGPLDAAGIALIAQHVDRMDVATLIDIFRAEPDSCLLGTDAVRDGVDVPGHALRLIVFDRVPWPRPTILHKARRAHFSGSDYDDMLARLRLRQAYGRLVRRRDDRGVFVLLDAMMPSRLAGAFPDGVALERVGLAEACGIVRGFVGDGKA